jgi:hypothetical protein
MRKVQQQPHIKGDAEKASSRVWALTGPSLVMPIDHDISKIRVQPNTAWMDTTASCCPARSFHFVAVR